jgi:hypothetical protein
MAAHEPQKEIGMGSSLRYFAHDRALVRKCIRSRLLSIIPGFIKVEGFGESNTIPELDIFGL